MRILLVEDDQPLVRIITKSLDQSGFDVDVATDGEDGLHKARNGGYDSVVLDLQLPKMSGVEVCKTLRDERNDVPILMLTARSARLRPDRRARRGRRRLPAQAVLAGRARGAPARPRPAQDAPTSREVLEAGGLDLDTGAREVRVGATPVELTGTEFALLEYLMRNAGQVLSRDQLREEVWGAGFEPASNVVDIYVHYVRRKLKAAGLEKDPIRTVRGLGYAFRRPD